MECKLKPIKACLYGARKADVSKQGVSPILFAEFEEANSSIRQKSERPVRMPNFGVKWHMEGKDDQFPTSPHVLQMVRKI